jgi:hypothetical protein
VPAFKVEDKCYLLFSFSPVKSDLTLALYELSAQATLLPMLLGAPFLAQEKITIKQAI